MLSSGLLEIWLSATGKCLIEPRASRIQKKKKSKRKKERGENSGKIMKNAIVYY